MVLASIFTDWVRFLILSFACDTILSLPGPAVWVFLHVMTGAHHGYELSNKRKPAFLNSNSIRGLRPPEDS